LSSNSQLQSSKSSTKTSRRIKTNASITKIGLIKGKGRKPALNPNIFKAIRLKRIPKKTVFLDGVLLLIKELKVVYINRELNHKILIVLFKAITIKEAIKTDLES